MTNITIFDRRYSADKQAAGLAIHWAVASGACDSCRYIKQCETNDMFVMPPDAACMVRKKIILIEMTKDE